MPTDYEALTKHNERQLGLDTKSRQTQICMYSDSTHFVYEILQNADDYGATEILFRLSKNALLIEHNGETFTEDNVKSITYFGKSTSRDDLVKTGRFGVGFKSVFAFTATPIIISGDEHFQIHGLYRVREHSYPDDLSRLRTRIILPFNHDTEKPDYVETLVSQEVAYSKISARLTGLNMNTLLFTRSIREIRWEIDGRSGHYLREDQLNDNMRWTTITDGTRVNKYLVFSRVPQWKSLHIKTVDIAFAVDNKNQLISTDDFLYVLFATSQETHLQFMLNGPYRTNPSRETISEEDQFNIHLINETGVLMKEVLLWIRGMGLLTPQFLSVLPNGNDKLRDFYTALRDVIIEAFREHDLVPTDDNQHASSDTVLQGPAAVREVISREELSFLVGIEKACWAKGVPPNSRADYFLRSLGIEQWSWEQLQDTLNYRYGRPINNEYDRDNAWLAARSDSWLQRLYILLADAITRRDCFPGILRQCRIVRVSEGRKDSHIAGSEAYFPKGRSYKELPQVKRSILRGRNEESTEKLQESLAILGVCAIGEEERIDLLLETYYSDEVADVSAEQHLKHIMMFMKWWKKEDSATRFSDHSIFYTAGKKALYKPAECFLDSPLKKSGLAAIYSQAKSGIPQKVKLWTEYGKLAHLGFCEFAVACGAVERLPIERGYCQDHPLWDAFRDGAPGARKAVINNDYYIPELTELLSLKNQAVNHLIWQTVSKAEPEMFEAVYRHNRQSPQHSQKASFILELSDACWIPDKKGERLRPCDMTREQLHPLFKYDNRNGWLDAIGFGEKAKKRSEEYLARNDRAQLMGFESAEEAEEYVAVARWAKDNNISAKELIAPLKSVAKNEALTFPSRPVSNADRRQEQLLEQLHDAPHKQYASRSASVRTTRGMVDPIVWLRSHYRNDVSQMVCQICKREMPFKKRDGEYYFEAVEAFPAEYFSREHEAQFLALCPLCAAMYKEFVKLDAHAMSNLSQALMTSTECEVALSLGDLETSIRFVEKHFFDIRTVLESTDW